MNLSQLPQFTTPQVQHLALQPANDENFLSLKLLNKRSRVRLSAGPLNLDVLPSRAQLFAVTNSKGWFAAVTQTSETRRAIICSPLSDLREAFNSSPNTSAEELPFTPKRTVDISDTIPNLITFAYDGARLIVVFAQGDIVVFDTAALFTPGSDRIVPLHTFLSKTNSAPRLVLPNPAETPFIATIHERGLTTDAPAVEVFNVETMQSLCGWTNGTTPETTATTLSWSPKGKLLAIGLKSGDIIAFDPSSPSNLKTVFPHPPNMTPQSIVSATWLSNPAFHAIYIPMHVDGPDIELSHYFLSLDSKSKAFTTTKLAPPCLPFPGLRPLSAFSLVLRGWNPAKFLILVGDSASSDIGAITCTVNPNTSSEEWRNLSLDETTQPTMPLDKDTADTVLVGLELDLTVTQSISHTDSSGTISEVSRPPIMYAYASDGTVLGWYLINPRGGQYPGMINLSAPAIVTTAAAPGLDSMVVSRATSTYGEPMTTSTNTPTSAFGQAPNFGQFGQPPTFGGQPQATSAVSAFSSTSQTATFGQSSAFKPSSTSPFAGSSTTPAKTAGFSAFASAAPAKFGQTGFGFASSSSTTPAPQQPQLQQLPDEMMADSPAGIGRMSLGDNGADDKPVLPYVGGSGIFGSASAPLPLPPDHPSNQPQPPSSESGTNALEFIKPAAGFGAFANYRQQQASATQGSQTPKPTAPSAFGKSGFDAPAFGKSGFTQAAPAFGKTGFVQATPTFGKSGFGSTSTLAPTSTSASTSTSSGFSSFAQGGPTSFLSASNGTTAGSTKPAWASDGDSSKGGFGNASGGSGVFGGTATQSAFSKTSGSGVFGDSSNRLQPSGTSTFGGTGGAFRTPFTAQSPVKTSTPSSAPKPASFADRQSDTAPTSPPLSPTTTPPPNLFTSTAPAPTTSAFVSATSSYSSTSTSTSTFLKPAAGFGAFGSSTPKSSSPFFNPPAKPATTTSPAFSSALSTAPDTTAAKTTTTPAFGATSALGNVGKPVFGSSSLPAPSMKMTMAPTSGGFGAFSGSSSGFGAFAGPQKSFGELLKEGGDDAKGQQKVEAVASESTKTRPNEDEGKEKLGPTPNATQPQATGSEKADASSSLKDTPTTPRSSLPRKPREQTSGTDADSEDEERPARLERFSEETVAALEPSKPSDAPSFSTLSLSSLGSSFVDISEEPATHDGNEIEKRLKERVSEEGGEEIKEKEEEEEEEGEGEEGESDGKEEGEEEEVEEEEEEESAVEDNQSESVASGSAEGVSEDVSSEEQHPSEEHPNKTQVSDEEDKVFEKPADSEERPLPQRPGSRSASATPAPDVSAVTSKPTASIDKTLPGVRTPASSLTPPGSPAKVASPPPRKSSPVPTPASSLGSGQLGARPARGSPLAQASVAVGEHREKDVTPVVKASPRIASPSPWPLVPLGQQPASVGKPDEVKASPGSRLSLPQRPGTPTPSATTTDFISKDMPAPSAKLPSFAVPPPIVASSFSPFEPKSTTPITPASAGPAPLASQPQQTVVIPASSSRAETPKEEGMQAECVYLIGMLGKELEQLRSLAQDVSRKCVNLTQVHPGRRDLVDLCDITKWGPADLAQWGSTLQWITKDIAEAEERRKTQLEGIKVVQNDLLRAATKKEEIIRFERAKNDEDFAKQLKVRSLGPEHMETQGQLRRDIWMMRDRIQKLEDHLQASKKKLNQFKTGKPGIRPPSLDTISRTYRNIDRAITQQSSSIESLIARISQLELSSPKSVQTLASRDLPPNSLSTQRLGAAPGFVATAAAALNAEQSAQKLKRALLALRKQPRLNVASATPVTVTSATTPAEKESSSFFPKSAMPDWPPSLPAFEIEETAISPFKARRSPSAKLHSKAIPLKKSHEAAPAAAFDWGPLPTVAPMSTLSSDLRNSR